MTFNTVGFFFLTLMLNIINNIIPLLIKTNARYPKKWLPVTENEYRCRRRRIYKYIYIYFLLLRSYVYSYRNIIISQYPEFIIFIFIICYIDVRQLILVIILRHRAVWIFWNHIEDTITRDFTKWNNDHNEFMTSDDMHSRPTFTHAQE